MSVIMPAAEYLAMQTPLQQMPALAMRKTVACMGNTHA